MRNNIGEAVVGSLKQKTGSFRLPAFSYAFYDSFNYQIRNL